MKRHTIVATVVVLLGAPACGSTLAPDRALGSKTDTLTWSLTNSINASVDVRFFDETYGNWYPSRTAFYPLNPGDNHVYELQCSANANICYGATVHSNQNQFFGVSVYNDQQCSSQGCCHVCDGSVLTPISLSAR